MSSTEVEKQMVPLAYVAKRIGGSTRTARRLYDGGEVPGYKIGGMLRFDPDDIERYIESCRREAAPEPREPEADAEPTEAEPTEAELTPTGRRRPARRRARRIKAAA